MNPNQDGNFGQLKKRRSNIYQQTKNFKFSSVSRMCSPDVSYYIIVLDTKKVATKSEFSTLDPCIGQPFPWTTLNVSLTKQKLTTPTFSFQIFLQIDYMFKCLSTEYHSVVWTHGFIYHQIKNSISMQQRK